jgi:hypothetical protein
MGTKTTDQTGSDVALFGRLLAADRGDLAPDLARYILTLGFSLEDKARMHDLAVRNQSGSLSKAEQKEMQTYQKVGHLLDLLQSKARKSLKQNRRQH